MFREEENLPLTIKAATQYNFLLRGRENVEE